MYGPRPARAVDRRLLDRLIGRRAPVWAGRVESDELVEVDTGALDEIAALADQRDDLEAALAEAVRKARLDNRSWSEIGAMLGVSKQAPQRRFSKRLSA